MMNEKCEACRQMKWRHHTCKECCNRCSEVVGEVTVVDADGDEVFVCKNCASYIAIEVENKRLQAIVDQLPKRKKANHE